MPLGFLFNTCYNKQEIRKRKFPETELCPELWQSTLQPGFGDFLPIASVLTWRLLMLTARLVFSSEKWKILLSFIPSFTWGKVSHYAVAEDLLFHQQPPTPAPWLHCFVVRLCVWMCVCTVPTGSIQAEAKPFWTAVKLPLFCFVVQNVIDHEALEWESFFQGETLSRPESPLHNHINRRAFLQKQSWQRTRRCYIVNWNNVSLFNEH